MADDEVEDAFKRARRETTGTGYVVPEPSPAERRFERWQAEELARQARTADHERNLHDRLERGVINRHDATYERARFQNDELVAMHVRDAEMARVGKRHEEIVARAKEHADILAEQARQCEQHKVRDETLGHTPFAIYDEFAPGSDRFQHERERLEQLLGKHDMARNPYTAQQRAAQAECDAFLKEQERYVRRIEDEHDLSNQRQLVREKEIRAADHIAFTSDRIARQEEAIAGARTDEAEKFYVREQEEIARSDRLRGSEGRNLSRDQATSNSNVEQTDQKRELTDAQQSRLGQLGEFYNSPIAPTRPRDTGRGGQS